MTTPDNIRRQVVKQAGTVYDKTGRVLATGGEPTYAAEKLARALRATVHALAPLGRSPSDFAEEIKAETRR